MTSAHELGSKLAEEASAVRLAHETKRKYGEDSEEYKEKQEALDRLRAKFRGQQA